MAGSSVIARHLERVVKLPFASPSGFVVRQANSPQARAMLAVAQDPHGQVLDAIERREGSRAESILREHSRIAQRNLHATLQRQDFSQMPALAWSANQAKAAWCAQGIRVFRHLCEACSAIVICYIKQALFLLTHTTV